MLSEEDFIRELTASRDRLFAFILTLLPDVNGAGDVLQETHIEMWRKRGQFAEGTHFIGWACQIARYKVFEHRRAMGREKLVFDEELVFRLAKDAGQHAEQTPERMGILEACLAKLSARQRALIGERYGLGHSVKQIAERLGRSAGALAVALFRIRQALLECIERKVAEGLHE
jgi:RNA polymerase sigma-70 factor, ECF subfamily